jgi:hypothetical protein
MRFILNMSTQAGPDTTVKKWLTVIFSALLLISFFLPWVGWDGSPVSGKDMPTGHFFKTSEALFGLGNPFPKLSFTLAAFWLIPALAILTGAAAILRKKSVPLAFLAGSLSLALLTVFIAFTSGQIDPDIFKLLKPAAYIQAISAIGLILSAFPVKSVIPKIGWLLVGPVIAFIAYKAGEKFIYGETHAATENVKAEYELPADELIREFLANDTAANKKYLEKVIVVNGKAAAVDVQADSTSTIRFADSTGSYAIFSLEKNQFEQVKNIHAGDPVSAKGVCSGSIFSDILGTTSISFKRATLNNK